MGRLRTNTNAPLLIKEFINYCELNDLPLSKKPIHIEIGSGKGDFLIELALKNPSIQYVGIEKYSTVILKALKKIKRNNLKLNNLYFCCIDAGEIDVNILRNKVSKLYLNFSDPWPKKRHAKRRLTSPAFLDFYKQILKPKSIIEFKTDNDGLYAYSLEILQSRKDIKIHYFTNDLYGDLNNKMNINNVQTEYEKKFVKMGKNINKIVFSYN